MTCEQFHEIGEREEQTMSNAEMAAMIRHVAICKACYVFVMAMPMTEAEYQSHVPRVRAFQLAVATDPELS